ncbi:MAG: hypothetical protein CL907_04195 [Dehalococcoidia bacterium]|nr:hypothetical protein [Dehalococcoidia bacterium]|tara:strand:- start:6537 stop:7388 length:852 start_codon:yes stop_codon:yes gene_type:complete
MNKITVGLIGLGEMGSAIGSYLVKCGINVISDFSERSQQSQKRSISGGIVNCESLQNLCFESDIIFSIIPPDRSEGVAKDIVEEKRRNEFQTIYCDLNAISPPTSIKIGELILGAGIEYVDGGIIGGPPNEEVFPKVYVSGKSANKLKSLNKKGIDLRILSENVGEASAVKMCYASVTKGSTALMTGALITANKLGVFDTVMKEFEDSQKNFHNTMINGIPNITHKAYRWIGEMHEISSTFNNAGLDGGFHKESALIFDLMSNISKNKMHETKSIINEISDLA